jgi:O-succinylbenzoic acid--CoA ligase
MLKQSVLINHKPYQKQQLLELCAEKLSCGELSDWETSLYGFIQTWLDAADTLTLKTSGSTGTAKTIQVSKQAMRQSAQLTGEYFQLKARQNALLCLPTTHIAGQMMVVRAFELGLNLIITAPNAINLDTVESQTIDFSAMLPLQVHKLLFSKPCQQKKLAQIKTLLLGGASVHPKLLNAILNLKTAVYQSYAMTETVSHIAVRRLNPAQKKPFYTLLSGVNVEQDQRGCLIIHAPCLGVNNLITNDLVKLHSATEFELLGRFDNLINSGGIKFNPEQLEEKLATVITDQHFFITGLDDERLGQKLVLVIESAALSEEELEQLQCKIKTVLDKYARPKEIYLLAQFQETPTGKIRRDATLLRLND